jgi:hypothetical protein
MTKLKLKLPALSAVQDIVLKDASGNELPARTIWADTPTFIFCLRRPGCGEHRAASCSPCRDAIAAT